MPEEIFDLVEELFEGRDKRRKRKKRSGGDVAEYREPRASAGQPKPASRGLMGRVTSFFQPAPPPQPAPAEPDPRAALDAAYHQQLQLLEDVRQSVAEVSEARRRMQERAQRNEQRAGEFEEQARAQLAHGREDLARVALERKRLAAAQTAEFERELATLGREQAQLMRAEARLEAKIETFRTRREVLRSQRASAEAQARISEAYGGLSEESSDVAYTVRRIESHTTELRSRGAAVDQMLDEGLVDGVEDPHSRFERRLELSEVDADLERLRRELDEGRDESMIVRIVGEGQFQLDDTLINDLNELDGQLQEWLEAGDEVRFSALLHQMAGLVREHGTPLPDGELLRSNAILPPDDATVDEVRALLGAEGLIPG